MDRIRHLWAHHRKTLIVFTLIIGAIVFFGVRTMTATLYWMNPDHQNQAIAPWMTPRYIAKSYNLPPDVLGPALFLTKDAPPRRISLGNIAAENNMDMDALQVRIDAAATQWRDAQADKTP